MKRSDTVLVVALFMVLFVVGYIFSSVMARGENGNENCKLPGKNHGDNKPSEKKADKLIREGAEVCELAQKCDSMEIDVKIKDKTELHKENFYQNAPDKVKKELDESATHGHGHDNPNLKCYEVEYAVK
jgi:hypothetical protein